jgi:hypothetical protein
MQPGGDGESDSPTGAADHGGDLVPRVEPRTPARHLQLSDLPPAVAERIRFDRAAPRRLRSDKLPAPVRDELSQLWDGVVADVYDEVAGLRRTRSLSTSAVERVLARVADRILQAERVIIFAAVHYPLSSDKAGRHLALAGLGGASAAAAEEIALFGSFGTATAVAILTAVMGEVFETYVAASARTRQYVQAGRSPEPDLVLIDLAQTAGYATSVGRRATPAMARDAAGWLGDLVIVRTASRFSRAIIPLAGVAIGAGMSVFNVRKVTKLALRAPAADEVRRMAEDVINDPDSYAEARRHYLDQADDLP